MLVRRDMASNTCLHTCLCVRAGRGSYTGRPPSCDVTTGCRGTPVASLWSFRPPPEPRAEHACTSASTDRCWWLTRTIAYIPG